MAGTCLNFTVCLEEIVANEPLQIVLEHGMSEGMVYEVVDGLADINKVRISALLAIFHQVVQQLQENIDQRQVLCNEFLVNIF